MIHWPADFDARRSSAPKICAAATRLLFPFAGRCHVDGAPGWWTDPEGVKRPYPQHGLVRQGAFEIVESGGDAVAARFVPAAGDAAVYPYSYDCHRALPGSANSGSRSSSNCATATRSACRGDRDIISISRCRGTGT